MPTPTLAQLQSDTGITADTGRSIELRVTLYVPVKGGRRPDTLLAPRAEGAGVGPDKGEDFRGHYPKISLRSAVSQ